MSCYERRNLYNEQEHFFLIWLEVMRKLPRWRYLAPLLSIWPFTALGRLFYRWLASRRYKLFGIPHPVTLKVSAHCIRVRMEDEKEAR